MTGWLFAELHDAAGADFVVELVNAFLEEAPAMLAELRSAHIRRPLPLPESELVAVRAALDMQEMVAMFNLEREALGKEPIRIGIGIASGESWRATPARSSGRPTPASATP